MRIRYQTLFTSKSGLEYLHLNSNGIELLSVQGKSDMAERIARVYSCGLRLYAATTDSSLKPVSCVCNDNTATAVFEGAIGGPLRDFLARAPAVVQYAEGKRVGRVLKAFHEQPVSEKQRARAKLRQDRFLERLAQYIGELPHFTGDYKVVDAISKRFGAYDCFRPCMRYGQLRYDRIFVRSDLSPILLPSSTSAPGDISEDFALMECSCAGLFPMYCAGVIDGYFLGEVPPEFFVSFALQSALYSLWYCGKQALAGAKSFECMQLVFERIVADFDDFQECVPKWYQARALSTVRRQLLRQGM